MIVKTRIQARKLAIKKGFVVNYDGFLTCTEKCNCFAWWKFWAWFKKDTTQYHHAAKEVPNHNSSVAPFGVGLDVVTILICEKCGEDYNE